MDGSNKIQSIILGEPAITALLDTFTDDTSNVFFASFNDKLIPTDFEGHNTINFYKSSNLDGGLEYTDLLWILNCRGINYQDASILQDTVFTTFNRYNKENYFFICNKIPVISPSDSTDNYNAPVEVRLRNKP